ncbi:NUDIX hydrolase [Alkalimarinus coralli]|uniref:NUDIX hydrolase n=1 Tax=Alkalimarinus coralli TaxID=2935863 RepID=UPI00202B5A82|nr:NUDIX hydrolase [Alkalimarinus coralli]
MKFCSECGSHLRQAIPKGDNRLRHICTHCEIVHYQNPKIVAGTLPVFDGKILLCKRAIEPRLGYWTLPAGFMENQETTTEAALRETLEEAEAKVELEGLYTVMNVPQIDQVHIFFRARLINGHFGAGDETLETKLFALEDIPWDHISFPTVFQTLKHYIADHQLNDFPVHVKDIVRKKA